MESAFTLSWVTAYRSLMLAAAIVVAAPHAQADEDTATRQVKSLCSPHSIFDNKSRQLFLPGAMPLRFFAAPQRNMGAPIPLDETADAPDSAVFFGEGEHTLALSSTKRQVFHFTADSTPPVTELTLSAAPSTVVNSETYYGKGLVLTLNPTDTVSGVDQLYLAINQDELKPVQAAPIPFDHDSAYSVQYFSCDRVGNAELLHTVAFKIDVTPPRSTVVIKKNGNHSALGPGALIAIRSEDQGARVRTISYRMDESKSETYESELTLRELSPGRHRLTFHASDAVGNEETPKHFEFHFDPTPPTIALTIAGPSHQEGDVMYAASSSGINLVTTDVETSVATTTLTMDGRTVVAKNGVYPLPTTEGPALVRATATDEAGNTVVLEQKVFVDATPPAVEPELLGASFQEGDEFVVAAPFRLRLRAKDQGAGVAEISQCIDAEACQIYANVIDFSQAGRHSVSFDATDHVGQKSAKITLHLRVTAAGAGASVTPLQEITQWVADKTAGAIGPKSRPFRIEIADGPSLSARRFALMIPADAITDAFIGADSHRRLVISAAGTAATITLPVDSKSPVSSHLFADANHAERAGRAYWSKGVTCTLTAEDTDTAPFSGVKQIMVGVNGQDFQRYTEPLGRQFRGEQAYNIRYYAVDRVGNREPEHSVDFTLDLSPPKTVATFRAPFNRNVIGPSGGIDLAAEDVLAGVAKILVSYDTQTEQDYQPQAFASALNALPSGRHRLTFHAVDTVGNREEDQVLDFVIDREPPVLTVMKPVGMVRTGGTVIVADKVKIPFRADDASSGTHELFCRFDDKPEAKCPGILDPSGLGDAATVQLRASDKVGNRSAPLDLKITIDRVAPQSQLIFSGPHYQIENRLYIKPETVVTIVAVDTGAGVFATYYRLNSGDYVPSVKPIQFEKSGEFNLSFFAQDRVGNRESPHLLQMIIDGTPPSIVVRDKEGNALPDTVPLPIGTLLHLSALDSQAGVRHIFYKVNGSEPQLYRQPFATKEKGKFSLEVNAADWVGGTNTSLLNYTVE